MLGDAGPSQKREASASGVGLVRVIAGSMVNNQVSFRYIMIR